jgi:hypothetical protein
VIVIALRRFNQNGIDAATDLLDRIDAGEASDASAILNDPALTELIPDVGPFDVRSFTNRFEAGEYFSALLEPVVAKAGRTAIARDKGLWTWLALAWMDVLAPPSGDGTRKLKAHNRWIPNVEDYRKYYRHLLAGPYLIYEAHKDDPARALAVLATPVEKPGEVVEQFASRQEMITSVSLMAAITALYYDSARKQIKRGAAGKAGGSSRRLADVLGQFDVTWDIYGMPSDEILDLLPSEFDRFKSA